jgi:hypothetical protein
MEEFMRVSDERYSQDRLRLDLAMRLLRHGARSFTIAAWTGLSIDRIRTLYRNYVNPTPSAMRLRGRPPQQADYFLQTAELSFEASTLACLFQMLGLMPPPAASPARSAPSLERAAAFCTAYETYLVLKPDTRLTLEHAWALMLALLPTKELRLTHCRQCGRRYLTFKTDHPGPNCGCGPYRAGRSRRGRLPIALMHAYDTCS